MRRHAKASSAGSTQGSGSSRGSVSRAFATRDASAGGKGSGARSVAHRSVLVAALVLLAVGLFASSASAAVGHLYESQLTEAKGTPFVGPWGLSVDSSNNLWVTDVGPGRIDKFSSAGTFLAQGTSEGHWSGQYTRSIAFSNASSHLYIADSDRDDLWVLNSDASFNSDIKGPWGTGCCLIYAAADNSGGASDGIIYIAGEEGVYRIDGTGSPAPFSGSASYIEGAKLTGTEAGSFSGNPESVAVGPNGELFVVNNTFTHQVEEFAASGVFIRSITEANGEPLGTISALAVDPTSGDVLVGDSTHSEVHEFDSSGAFAGSTTGADTPAGSLGEVQGIAVDSTGTVYVSDRIHGVVDVFGPAVTLASASTGEATAVTNTSATLAGTINPASTAATYQFQYGTTKAYGQLAPATPQSAGNDSSDHLEEVGLTGLQPSTLYHYRVNGINSNGTNHGADRTFRTTGPPTIEEVAVSEISGIGATVQTRINPSGFDATYKVEYGTSASYGSETTPIDIGASNETQTSTTTLSGLQVGTTYHYRIVATNSQGIVETVDGTFKTGPAVRIAQQSVSGITKVCATLEAIVNPEGSPTSVAFEYGTTEVYGSETAPTAIGTSAENQFVGTQVCGLTLGTVYHFHAVATNPEGIASGTDQTFETIPAVRLEAVSVSEVTSDSVTFGAELNPFGANTTYHFEYGTTAAYGSSVPVPDGVIGATETPQPVSHHIQNLLPETTYHYRLVAVNSNGTVASADRTFTTQKTKQLPLPDSRAWEMVSPPIKEGNISPIGEMGLVQAAHAGDAISYLSSAPNEASPAGNATSMQVLSRRTASGWQSKDIQLPHKGITGASVGQGFEYRFFSSDLSQGLVQHFGSFVPSISAEASEESPLLSTNFQSGDPDNPCLSSCYRPLVTGTPGYANVPPGTEFGGEPEGKCPVLFCGPVFLDATSDLAHVLVSSGSLTTDLTPDGGIYEWSATAAPSEAIQLISVLPNGQPASGAGLPRGINLISDDGSRVIWKANESAGPLYLRDFSRAETVQLDGPESGCGSCEEGFGSLLQMASNDGSRIFFKSGNRLTADSGTGTFGDSPDLYECHVVIEAGKLACDVTDLTPAVSGENGGLQGFVGASPDGTSVYFVANGVYASGASQGNCTTFSPPETSCNLYLRHNGVTTFVARLSNADNQDWIEPAAESLTRLTARVSPDGRWLAFMSQRELTGYDNRDVVTGEPDEEVFLYDSEADSLACASCNPTGARPFGIKYGEMQAGEGLASGDRVWPSQQGIAANIPGWTPNESSGALYQSRYLSNSGRLFFNSSDGLVPQDTNRNVDVYEYEPAAVGDCTVASPTFGGDSNGCVNLISSGTSKGEAGFLDASENGDDVFFMTGARLTAQDVDTAADVYDAHACSSASPCFPPLPPPTPACEGDACQNPAVPPVDVTPSSLTFRGAGNLHEESKAKKKHKKKKKSRKKHAKKSHKRTGHNRGGAK